MHRNARLTPQGRLLLCQRIEGGWPVAHAAAAMGGGVRSSPSLRSHLCAAVSVPRNVRSICLPLTIARRRQTPGSRSVRLPVP
jgi:hypothetical protein